MKLLVVSDSHGDTEILKDLKARYEQEMDAMFHCGDSELPADSEVMKGYIVVRGNCDMDDRYPYDIVEEIKGKRIFMTHGHRYDVKASFSKLKQKAKANKADFVFFGHSHQAVAEKIGETLFLNPGSILLPRGRKERTYAIVELDGDDSVVLFYNEQHQLLTD
ncbi:metallophosphoesterase [Bacillus smithii]|uniref:metallophosphoesterase n=1 Tax=Bacillus smithii TaxID=1479 RepID=UPI0030C9EC91